jgi:hypothetical protein
VLCLAPDRHRNRQASGAVSARRVGGFERRRSERARNTALKQIEAWKWCRFFPKNYWKHSSAPLCIHVEVQFERINENWKYAGERLKCQPGKLN